MKFIHIFIAAFLLIKNGLASVPYVTERDSYEFTYSLIVPDLEAGQAGRVWIPIASSDSFQQVDANLEMRDLKVQKSRDAKFKNLIMNFDITPTLAQKTLTFKYRVVRTEKAPYLNTEKNLAVYLESEPLIPLDARFKKLANEITQSKKSDLEKGRAIYEHVLSIMKYDKTGTGWGRGDAVYACDAKKGNCTDFHALFIAIARSAKIPSRFMIGFTIPPDKNDGKVEGYHCWAEFLADGKWIPIDISEASKNPSTKDYYFGHHPANRFELTHGRQLSLNPSPKAGAINFLVHPYIEINGKEVKATTEYYFRRLTSKSSK